LSIPEIAVTKVLFVVANKFHENLKLDLDLVLEQDLEPEFFRINVFRGKNTTGGLTAIFRTCC
jgi:hypothetical protein